MWGGPPHGARSAFHFATLLADGMRRDGQILRAFNHLDQEIALACTVLDGAARIKVQVRSHHKETVL